MKNGKICLAAALCLLLAAASGALAEPETVTVENKIASVRDFVEQMQANPDLKRLRLIGTGLNPAKIKAVKEALPGVEVYAEFRWFGQQWTTDMTEAGIKTAYKLQQITDFLDVMPALQRFDMYCMDMSVGKMEKLMAAYPQITFGWKVPIAFRKVRSDATAFSSLKGGSAQRFDDEYYGKLLPYCPHLLALDLGHNTINSLDFLAPFPELKVLILADNQLSDISRLPDYTPNLEYLELFMNQITDISALPKLTHLRDLNLCHNQIADPSPLLEMPWLERCWISHNTFSEEWWERLQEALPNCRFEFTVWSSTGNGWRQGHPHYLCIQRMFHSYQYEPFPD